MSTKDGEGDKKATSSVVAEKKSESEPSFELLSNPARVLPQQVNTPLLLIPFMYNKHKSSCIGFSCEMVIQWFYYFLQQWKV